MFLPILAEDNEGIDEDTQDILDRVYFDLGSLLQLGPGAFWQSIKADRSLHACLASYLQFARYFSALRLGGKVLVAHDSPWCKNYRALSCRLKQVVVWSQTGS